MWTHRQTQDLLQQIATKHQQINSFGIGDYSEIGSDKLILYYDTNNANKIIYPMLWAVPLSSRIDDKQISTEYDLLIMDVVDDSDEDLQDVLSNTQLIMSDVYALLRTPDAQPYFAIDKQVDLTPFTEKFDDAVAGWSGKYNFRVSSLRDRCAVPLSSSISITSFSNPS